MRKKPAHTKWSLVMRVKQLRNVLQTQSENVCVGRTGTGHTHAHKSNNMGWTEVTLPSPRVWPGSRVTGSDHNYQQHGANNLG